MRNGWVGIPDRGFFVFGCVKNFGFVHCVLSMLFACCSLQAAAEAESRAQAGDEEFAIQQPHMGCMRRDIIQFDVSL